MENLDKIMEELTNESKKIVDTLLNKIKSTETKVNDKADTLYDKTQAKLSELQKKYDSHVNLLLSDIHEGKPISDRLVSSIRSLYNSIESIKEILN